jgi:Uma2 family endonuclease
MGATTTLVTVQEFLQLPEPESLRMELIGGEVVTMGFGKTPHELVKSNVIQILAVWLAQNPAGRLLSETLYVLDEHNSFIPDVSVVFPGRIKPGSTDWIRGAPEIAIEVVSSEPAATLQRKVDLYLAHGGKSVWTVFPGEGVVNVVDASGRATRFTATQALEDPSVLPGFSIPVSKIFEGL